MAAAEPSFNTSIASISSGAMAFNDVMFPGIPSIITNGSLLPFKEEAPRI
ncbi:hypothetical protein EVA_15281 [gut metagenome]|uniref:Uncharacterized protein n=1 Tax=gut metagenome TaxID=749906 RepID=J9G482_9ZZZZ